MRNFEELELLIAGWAAERGLLPGDPRAQLLKTVEELGEVASALAKGRREELIDGIGDVVVTLILLSNIEGFSVTRALNQAYEEIKDRKGKLVDGIFIKDEASA
jgi:NTP pyrophosphatase (non-canonical NTP hydrolase)